MSDATAPLLRRVTGLTDVSVDSQETQPSDDNARNEPDPPLDDHKTQWRGLVICGVLMFLTTSMGQALAVAGWPYLRTIDPEVSVSFLGYVQALTRFANAIGCCLFAIHAYTTKTFKKALIIGRVISLIGCAFYILIEFFPPSSRRWAYMLKFVLQAVAEGSLIVVRSYVPRMSRDEDRPRAYSIVNGANMLAVVSGPLVQLICNYAFSPESFLMLGTSIKFNMYTVPIWISLALNCVTLYISIFHFQEPELEETEGDAQMPLGEAMGKAWHQIKQLDKLLLGLCFIEKSCVSCGFVVMYTMMSPYVTEAFNLSEDKALHLLSTSKQAFPVGQSAAGCISLLTVALFVFSPLARIAKARYLFPFALLCYSLMYLISFPIPGITEDIPLRNNVTAPFGCDAARYSWCIDGFKITQRYVWLALCSLLFGVGIPVSLISFDTIYAKVLGGIDQNIMQGLLIIVDDIALAGAPVIATRCFEVFGPGPMWLSVAGICTVGLVLWLAFLPKLRKSNI